MTTNTNSTRYADADHVGMGILDLASQADIDLNVVRAGNVAELMEDLGAIMDQVLPGHGALDPTVRRWLNDREDVLESVQESIQAGRRGTLITSKGRA